ncbi:hypothetical protein ACSXC4_03585 [Clostridium perfringens]|uniref:Lipoprotein n=1 Tax=Clostridium perfringens TaxID=1502 RepID=A0A127EHP9_CLOPF|nr:MULTISPECIES: hypothetical protein [Clostridium]AMN35470.1 hypothetical protein JFP838_06810 [Clostridium perfringens]MDK7589858.1 hypothetical protein [Clostridium sp. UMB9555B]MDK7627748.1 hypothetical protein [Clostridium sp. UMB9555A]HAT4336781.1 hypothetical protein [Clostridium perfringens]
MKKIISIFLSLLVVGTLFSGCGSTKNNNNQTEKKNENSIVSGEENSIVSQNELSQDEKAVYKEKAKKALEGLEVNDLTILTQNESKQPIVSVQVVFNGTKEGVNKNEVEKFIKDIKGRIEPVSKLYDISILDKNNQLIAMAGDESKGETTFLE